jgi:hypothetical protein
LEKSADDQNTACFSSMPIAVRFEAKASLPYMTSLTGLWGVLFSLLVPAEFSYIPVPDSACT